MGISPQYFLDEMSFDEIRALLDADDERIKRDWEKQRCQWFYTVIAQHGTDKIKKPEDLHLFNWEKKVKEGPKLSKEERDKRKQKAEKWLEKTKLR